MMRFLPSDLSFCPYFLFDAYRVRTRWKKAKKLKKVVKSVDVDYYKLLGLEQERWMATDDQIVKGGVSLCH